MTDEAGLPLTGVPDELLGPLLELTGEVLRALPPVDIPAGARRLASFDRRGLATPTARGQLRRLLETDLRLATGVADAYAQTPEGLSVLDGWTTTEAATRVAAAAGAGELPALACALVTARPAGWEFGLGMVVATFRAGRSEEETATRLRELETRVATLEEAVRRAEAARESAQVEGERLAAELRTARRARRAEEEQIVADLARAGRRIEELEAELGEAVRRRGEAEARARGEARRAAAEARARRAAEQAAGEAAAAATRPEMPAPPPGPEPDAVLAAAGLSGRLAEMIGAAARLAEELEGVLAPPDHSGREDAPADAGGAGGRRVRMERPRRTPVPVPPGMLADTLEAAEAMVRTAGLAVVVDGYNVSMLAWPESSPADQRERLVGALTEFGLRTRVGITVIFDGADLPGARPPRRAGVRVVFSAAGQEADELVVAEVAARPLDVPVLVVSSDAWVRAEAEAHGAQVLASDLFLALLRR